MGCSVSKTGEQGAVGHCHDRTLLLANTIQHRYLLADAHAAYADSLRSLSSSLHSFLLSPPPPLPTTNPTQSRIKISHSNNEPQIQSSYTMNDPAELKQPEVILSYSKRQSAPIPAQSSNLYQYSNHFMDYTAMGGFFPSSVPPLDSKMQNTVSVSPPRDESPLPARPMMPPAENSGWGFLDPFESYDRYDRYYSSSYTSHPSFRKVREEEGIPELEDDVQDDDSISKTMASNGDVNGKAKSVGPSTSNLSDNSVKSSSEQKKGVAADAAEPDRVYRDNSEIVLEIETQFVKASQAADQVAKLLESGKRPYSLENSVYEVAVRMVCGYDLFSNSFDEDLLRFEEESGDLSSTLQKLYMWETKLLEEVQNEKKLRVMYVRRCEELYNSDKRGSENEKIEKIRHSIRKLSTRIGVAMQVLETVSNRIIQIRDEELWPQICELVHGLAKMWELMLQCHQTQCDAISQVKNLDSIFSYDSKHSDSNRESTTQLELNLLDLLTTFSVWIIAQKNYVKSLNDWLIKGLNYEPEFTEDGLAPFSPGRLGLPPIFVILNYWSEIMDNSISETEMVEAMQTFAGNVFQLREKQRLEWRERLMGNRDVKGIKLMEREDKIMRKEIQKRSRKLVSISGTSGIDLYSLGPNGMTVIGDVSSLQSDLKQVLLAMENFASANVRAYEELHMHSEEDGEIG